ncbi:hypothetical protein EVJ58_g2558 [Rhodofomes roseus]|uniref:DUF7918 domain-containing protein n=1 Tax=Rhodofomes roseus TaxID=34475 RepID=A0A4Y9YSL0_9APHY|nr:hypothetical protein EVJ58_g2558 [Rhodofomes roseus]
MKYRDCEIYIACDGRPLDEYDVQVEGNVIECYVASESGKVFEIKCSNLSSHALVVNTAVDGRRFSRPISLRLGSMHKSHFCEDGEGGLRSLMFSNIAITDDDSAPKKLPWANNLGLIEVTVVRTRIEHTLPWSPVTANIENFGPIHETVKKGGLHCVSVGPRTVDPNPARSLVHVTYIDQLSAPHIIFKFKYRPRAILQAQGIIQLDAIEPQRRSASEDPHAARGVSQPLRPDRPQKRPRRDSSSSVIDLTDETVVIKPPKVKIEDGDNAEDAAALRAQIRALQRKLNQKRMHKTQVTVKKESSPIQAGQMDEDIIDLTED